VAKEGALSPSSMLDHVHRITTGKHREGSDYVYVLSDDSSFCSAEMERICRVYLAIPNNLVSFYALYLAC